jgi:hypothetical protein
MTVLLASHRDWECPNCGRTDRTPASVPNRYHPCPKLRGLMAPYLPAGVKAKVVAHDRDDYVNGDKVQTDAAGRPVMSITTERENGQDVMVFAPTANAFGRID